MARTWTKAQFSEPDGAPSGCIVALWLSPDQASALSSIAGQPAESLHVTLLHLGDADDLTDIQIAHILSTVDDVAAFWPPVEGDITGIGRFYASENSDGQDVIVALPSLPDLDKLRSRLRDDINWSGAQLDDCEDDFGFLPHITLAYVAPGAMSPINAIATIPLRFDGLTVCIGDAQTTIPFRGWMDGEMCYADAAQIGSGGMLFNEVHFTEPPEWLPLFPAPGDHLHPEYGVISLTPDRIERLVASINNGVYQSSIPIDAIPINAEHNEDDLKEQGALGWFKEARINADGSADVRIDNWTGRGSELLIDDRYRFVSPEFYTVWTDKKTLVQTPDVVTGLALCTRPFFKDLSIDRTALVASERGKGTPTLSLVRHDGEPVRFVASERGSNPAPEVSKMALPTPNTSPIADPTTTPDIDFDPNADTDGNAADPTLPTYDQWAAVQVAGGDMSLTAYVKFLSKWVAQAESGNGKSGADAPGGTAVAASENSAILVRQFSDVVKRLSASEKEVAAMKAKEQRKTFTDEVRGKSVENDGNPWTGNVEEHVEILESLPADKRAKYIARERERAVAQRASDKALGTGIGSDAPADASGAGAAKAVSIAQKLMTENKGMTFTDAMRRVEIEQPTVFAEYQANPTISPRVNRD